MTIATGLSNDRSSSERWEDATARQMLECGVTVQHITTSDLVCVHPNDDVAQGRRDLEMHGVDQAPLQESPIHRSISLADLDGATGAIESFARPIRVEEVVAGSTGLASLLPRFAERDHFYVLGGNGINGIVTRADLQLPPVSMAVLGLITSLEIALTELIATYSHGAWKENLSSHRRSNLNERFRKARKMNVQITELECLDLIDRFALLGSMENLRNALELPSKRASESLKRSIKDLRNPLAHGCNLINAHDDFDGVLDTIGKIQDLSARCWSLVADSPFVWDAYAATEIAPIELAGSETLATGTWHVITAHNPCGRVHSDESNQSANDRLRRELEQSTVSSIEEVRCSSTSGPWEEHSFAVEGLSRSDAINVAQRFGQRAIFEICTGTLRVISVANRSVERQRPWPQ